MLAVAGAFAKVSLVAITCILLSSGSPVRSVKAPPASGNPKVDFCGLAVAAMTLNEICCLSITWFLKVAYRLKVVVEKSPAETLIRLKTAFGPDTGISFSSTPPLYSAR
jgi:hypothetical protein